MSNSEISVLYGNSPFSIEKSGSQRLIFRGMIYDQYWGNSYNQTYPNNTFQFYYSEEEDTFLPSNNLMITNGQILSCFSTFNVVYDSKVFFFKTKPMILAEKVEEIPLGGILSQVIGLTSLLLPLVIGFLGLRKALVMLRQHLQKA